MVSKPLTFILQRAPSEAKCKRGRNLNQRCLMLSERDTLSFRGTTRSGPSPPKDSSAPIHCKNFLPVLSRSKSAHASENPRSEQEVSLYQLSALMPQKQKINLAKVLASLNTTCQKWGYSI